MTPAERSAIAAVRGEVDQHTSSVDVFLAPYVRDGYLLALELLERRLARETAETKEGVPSSTPDWAPAWRSVREQRGLSLREAARRAEIEPTHLSRVERGTRHLSLPAALRLARVLKMRALADQLEQAGACKVGEQ